MQTMHQGPDDTAKKYLQHTSKCIGKKAEIATAGGGYLVWHDFFSGEYEKLMMF